PVVAAASRQRAVAACAPTREGAGGVGLASNGHRLRVRAAPGARVGMSAAVAMIPAMPAVGLLAPELSEAQDIVALVGQHTTLQFPGDGRWRGACPFCESTAFQVRRNHGTFHC